MLVAIELFEPRARVGQPHAILCRIGVSVQARASIAHCNAERVVLAMGADNDLAWRRVRSNAMADGVFDEWLKQQRGDLSIEHLWREIDAHLKPRPKSDLLDFEITADELDFLPQPNLLIIRFECKPQQFTQARDHAIRGFRVFMIERGN